MKIDQAVRNGVIESLPEAKLIKSEELREKVYDAWAMSLDESGFKKIEEMKPSGNPDTPPLKAGTQADHLRSVARLAAAIAGEMNDSFEGFDVNIDEVIAGGLCHDLGKPYEFDLENQARWKADPSKTGFPSVRHPVHGVHVALSAGLPEEIVHIAGAHSREGEAVERSLAAEIVHHADYAFWDVLEKAGLLER